MSLRPSLGATRSHLSARPRWSACSQGTVECVRSRAMQVTRAKWPRRNMPGHWSVGLMGPAEASQPTTRSIRRSMTTSTTDHNDVISGTRGVASRDDDRRVARETKPSFKTTELIVYVLSVLGVLIASWAVDINADGQGFSAYQGWFLVTLLTIGYLISRGLAKSGSRDETR